MGRFSVRSREDYPPAEWPVSVADSATRLRSLVRAHVPGATSRISDTRVRNVPELRNCGTPLSVADDVIDRPVHDRAVFVEDAPEAVRRVMSALGGGRNSVAISLQCRSQRLHES